MTIVPVELSLSVCRFVKIGHNGIWLGGRFARIGRPTFWSNFAYWKHHITNLLFKKKTRRKVNFFQDCKKLSIYENIKAN